MKPWLLPLIICLLSSTAWCRDEVKLNPSLWTAKAKLSHITGLKMPANWQEGASFESFQDVLRGYELPKSWDWRKESPAQPGIRNQGNCGSCWAFGTTAALNWALSRKMATPVNLAEQEILSCSHDGSCGGGYFAHDYQQATGQSPEKEFPYVASDVRCKKNLSHMYKIAKWGYVGEKHRKPSVDELKAAIYAYGPISVTVNANNAFAQYQSGVFKGKHCGKGSTNHLVHLVGWDDDGGYFILGNSWGESWGEKGYMRIAYGCSRVGEAAAFVSLDGTELSNFRKSQKLPATK